MFSNVPGGSLLNNIGGNITNLGDKVNPTGAFGQLGSKLPGNLNNLNPANLAGTFTGGAQGGEVQNNRCFSTSFIMLTNNQCLSCYGFMFSPHSPQLPSSTTLIIYVFMAGFCQFCHHKLTLCYSLLASPSWFILVA